MGAEEKPRTPCAPQRARARPPPTPPPPTPPPTHPPTPRPPHFSLFTAPSPPIVSLQQGIGQTHVLSCPKNIVGRIIGRQGDTIKHLQRVSGALAGHALAARRTPSLSVHARRTLRRTP
jgi:hypothetical protein